MLLAARTLGLYLNSVAGVVGRQDVAGYADVVTKYSLLLSSMLKRFMDSRHSAWNYDAIGTKHSPSMFSPLIEGASRQPPPAAAVVPCEVTYDLREFPRENLNWHTSQNWLGP